MAAKHCAASTAQRCPSRYRRDGLQSTAHDTGNPERGRSPRARRKPRGRASARTAYATGVRTVTVQINNTSTALDSKVSFNLRGPAGVVLPALVKDVWPAI